MPLHGDRDSYICNMTCGTVVISQPLTRHCSTTCGHTTSHATWFQHVWSPDLARDSVPPRVVTRPRTRRYSTACASPRAPRTRLGLPRRACQRGGGNHVATGQQSRSNWAAITCHREGHLVCCEGPASGGGGAPRSHQTAITYHREGRLHRKATRLVMIHH